MSFTPGGNYSQGQKITATNAPASTLSGFIGFFTADNVDSTFWDNVDNGGGDIRVSINEDGTSQLPLQVEICNTTTDKLYAWVRFPTYSTAAREIYIYSGNPGQSKEGDGTTYGRDNVWQDYLAVNHGRDLVNSTGGNNFTVLGTAPTAISQKHGAGWNFNAGNGLLLSAITAGPTPEFTLESFGGFVDDTIPGALNDQFLGVVSLAVNASSFGLDYTMRPFQSDSPLHRMDADTPQNSQTTAFSENGDYFSTGAYFAQTRDSDSLNISYGFGPSNDESGSFTDVPSNTTDLDVFGIGGRADASETYYNNVTVEARARIGVLSADHLAEHASNYLDPGLFWTQSAPFVPGGGGTDVDVDVTGVEATGAVGTATVTTGSVVALTGVEATGAVGTVTVVTATNVDVDVTGVAATGAVGTTTVTTGSVVALTGVAATGAVGTVTITATTNVNIDVTGVEATGAVGTVTVIENTATTVTGVQTTTALGSVSIVTGAVVALTGVEATGAVGTATVELNTSISVTGVQATTALGSVTALSTVIVPITGLVAYARTSTANVWGLIDSSQTPSWDTIANPQVPDWNDIPT